MNSEVTGLVDSYSGRLSELDVHYLSAKYYGANDTASGRSTFNLIGDTGLYHITFSFPRLDTPYRIDGRDLLYNGEALPFRVDFVERFNASVGRYYYCRHFDHVTPTLDGERVLNINFIRQCFNCKFCQYELYRAQPNISVEEGFRRIMAEGGLYDLTKIDYIAVVTGLCGGGEKVLEFLTQIVVTAAKNGFKGQLFYMGFELGDPRLIEKLLEIISTNGLSGLRLAYTLELFENRGSFIHGMKSRESLPSVVSRLSEISTMGLDLLEYSYIPGLDQYDAFMRGAEMLHGIADPHICIYRPWKVGQWEEQVSSDYKEMGPKYLCDMRLFYEDMLGRQVFGNQLANLWPFPRGRFDPRWESWRITGDDDFSRYWEGLVDPRKCSIHHGEDNGK
jgi:hypothetical protein